MLTVSSELQVMGVLACNHACIVCEARSAKLSTFCQFPKLRGHFLSVGSRMHPGVVGRKLSRAQSAARFAANSSTGRMGMDFCT